MFERLSEQRTRPCTGLKVGTALGFWTVRYGSEGGSGLVDLVDMSVAVDQSRDFTEQTPRSVSLPSSKALQKCDCGISKLELRAVVMIKTESPQWDFRSQSSSGCVFFHRFFRRPSATHTSNSACWWHISAGTVEHT